MERDEDGIYVVECPLLKGCYTQGDSMEEALKNIREVIEMCLEEENKDRVSEIAGIQEIRICDDKANRQSHSIETSL